MARVASGKPGEPGCATVDFVEQSGSHDDDRLKLSVTPQPGMALIFDHIQLHKGAPVTSGRKYVIRTDVMYRPVG